MPKPRCDCFGSGSRKEAAAAFAGVEKTARPDQAAQHFSMSEELIRQERAKTGDMGMSGTERKSFRREPAIL
jgi:hypothetical protein